MISSIQDYSLDIFDESAYWIKRIIKTIMDIYSHFVQTSDNGAAEKLERTFELKKEAKENGFNNIKEYIKYLKQSI